MVPIINLDADWIEINFKLEMSVDSIANHGEPWLTSYLLPSKIIVDMKDNMFS